MSAVGSVFEKRVVLFLDFLGFTNEVSRWDDNQARRAREILVWLASSKSEFSTKTVPLQGGGQGRQVMPALTAFSDNIVASYPAEGQAEYQGLDRVWINGVLLNELQRMVAAVAARALQINLLVRGGITIGHLYHSDGVVFGEGLIDAYRLETKVANYPRVVVSPRVYSVVPEGDLRRVLTDDDGIRHLDYFRGMLKNMVPEGPEEEYPERMRICISECNSTVDRNTDMLCKGERWNEFAKWSWFKNRVIAAAHPYTS